MEGTIGKTSESMKVVVKVAVEAILEGVGEGVRERVGAAKDAFFFIIIRLACMVTST